MKSLIMYSLAPLTLVSLACASLERTRKDPRPFTQAKLIHEKIITIDTHVDIPPDFGTRAYDPIAAKKPLQKLDLPGMKKGGLDAAFFIVYVSQRDRNPSGYALAMADALVKFSAIRRMTDLQHSDRIALALTATDVRHIHKKGKRAALIGIENGYVIGRNLDLLDIYYNLGARYLGLLHNGHNDIGDSAVPGVRHQEPESEHGGLSQFGKSVIIRANELGMIVDISHGAMTTALASIKASKVPVIASHSAVRAIRNHPRNLSDETLLALRDNGGVIHIVAFDSYLKEPPEEKQKALTQLREDMGLKDPSDWDRLSERELKAYYARRKKIDLRWPKASIKDLVDHIDYAVRLIGIDHVGISSDFNGGGGVAGWEDASETLNVTVELLRRGYSESDIAKLWGENLLRVMEAVESFAKSSKK